MNPFAAPSRSSVPTRANGLLGPRLSVVFFGVNGDIVQACHALAREIPFARTEAKHLFAACTAVAAFGSAMLVVSTTVRPWDRDVTEDHARRLKAHVLWVGAHDAPDDVVRSVRAWATTALRRVSPKS